MHGHRAASAERNTARRRAPGEWRIEAKPRLCPRVIAVVQSPQDQIGESVEIGLLIQWLLKAEVTLGVVGGESETAERLDLVVRKKLGARLIVIEARRSFAI